MTKFTNPLSNIKIASPCSADWDEMMGNERRRFCGDCKLNVYNLSGMSQREAENLLLNSEGRLCLRFYKRADGTILTKDCPVGWQAIRQRVSKMATAFASLVFAALSGIGLANYFAGTTEQQLMKKVSLQDKNFKVGESKVEEINSNTAIIAVQEQTEAIMRGLSVENLPIAGELDNVEEVKQHLRKKRNR